MTASENVCNKTSTARPTLTAHLWKEQTRKTKDQTAGLPSWYQFKIPYLQNRSSIANIIIHSATFLYSVNFIILLYFTKCKVQFICIVTIRHCIIFCIVVLSFNWIVWQCYVFITVYIYIYTECNRRNGPDFGRVFLRSNYTDITQNTYIQSWTVTEILAREKSGLLWCLCTVLVSVTSFSPLLELHSYVRASVAPATLATRGAFSSV